jgi:hypothetical protein
MNKLLIFYGKDAYSQPAVEIVDIAAERGFFGSLESPEPDGEL